MCIQTLKDELTRVEPHIYDNLLRSHYGYLMGLINKAMDEYT